MLQGRARGCRAGGCARAAASAPEPQAQGAREVPEDALLRAAHLAVRGTARGEIEAALREEFGLLDPGPVVDEILGADRR